MKFKNPKDIVDYLLNPGNILSNPFIEKCADIAKFISPNKSKNEKAIREKDLETVKSGNLGESVRREPSFIGGKPNLNKITMGVAVWHDEIPITEQTVKYIYDAGFDLVACPFDEENPNRDKLVDLAAKYDIAVLTENHKLPDKGAPIEKMTDESIFERVPNKPNVLGNYGWDEPDKSKFRQIGRYSELFKKAFPDKVMFNNLFPARCAEQQYGTKSYKDYVESYAKNVSTDYISVDIYPFYSIGLINFFGMLQGIETYDTIGRMCRKYGRDFWIYTQTQGNWLSHIYHLPTFEQIKWQIYTCLAYGARLFIEIAMDPCWGRHAYSMMNRDGTLTEQYLYAKRVNEEIKALSPVISKYRSLGVLPSESEKANHMFDMAFRYQRNSSKEQGFSGINEVAAVTSEFSALVGYFKHGETDSKALMIVNCKDLFDSGASQCATVHFNGKHNVSVYKKGKKVKEFKDACKVYFRFESCDGVFITID